MFEGLLTEDQVKKLTEAWEAFPERRKLKGEYINSRDLI